MRVLHNILHPWSRRKPWTPVFLWTVLLSVVWLVSGPNIASSKTRDSEEATNIRVYEEVHKSVVNITTVVIGSNHFSNPYASETSGSGIVLDKKGNLLTNHHVVSNAALLEVTLDDNTKWKAEIVGSDPTTDLSVIRIKAPPEEV